VLDAPLDEHGLALSRLEPPRCRAELGFDLAAGPVSADALNAVLARWPRLDSAGAALRFPGWEGLLTGFIDLVFEHDGRYFVLDYKSNHLGDAIEDYDRATMHRAMAEHRYDLQYLLYLVALQRLLRQRLGTRFDYRRHVGGVYYLFLRGIDPERSPRFGVFHDRPPALLIDALDAALATPEHSA
jgi:exodeoxyribonuclease V beta subunit